MVTYSYGGVLTVSISGSPGKENKGDVAKSTKPKRSAKKIENSGRKTKNSVGQKKQHKPGM